MRNFQSYLVDCDEQKMEPSPFQLILFLYTHEICLALPLPLLLIKAIHHVAGFWVGARLLGYSASYPEYWKEQKQA